jgi:hypothetical protein
VDEAPDEPREKAGEPESGDLCHGGGAPRIGDVARGQTGRGNLVEQGLKEVVIAAIDDGRVDGGVGKLAGRGEAAEPGSDHHDARQGKGGAHRQPTLSA